MLLAYFLEVLEDLSALRGHAETRVSFVPLASTLRGIAVWRMNAHRQINLGELRPKLLNYGFLLSKHDNIYNTTFFF